MRKGFLYKNELDEFIIAATESGLTEKWHSNTRIRFDHKYAHEEIQSGLMTLDNLSGMMIFWMFLNVNVALVFCLEIIVYRRTRKPNARRFWKSTEMVIDPERHFMLENKWV